MNALAHSLVGLAAQALLLAWVTWKVGDRLPSPHRRLLAAGMAALSLLPLADGISAAMALRALWGDPSVTTLQLLALSFASRPVGIHRPAALTLGLLGLAFYPLALGLGDFDPYRIGFAGSPLVVVLACLAIGAWWRGHSIYLWLLAVDLAAFAFGLLESTNLWDYLFDPMLVGAALVFSARRPAR